jgi:hypothetical protein
MAQRVSEKPRDDAPYLIPALDAALRSDRTGNGANPAARGSDVSGAVPGGRSIILPRHMGDRLTCWPKN